MVRILCAGEALVDVVVGSDGVLQGEHAGGSVFNVACGLARLGAPVTLASWWGSDSRGAILESAATRAGLRVFPGSNGAGHTTTATAFLDASGAATYEFDLEWDLPAGFEPTVFASGDAAQPGMAPHETGTTGVTETGGMADVTDAIVTNATGITGVTGAGAVSVTGVAGASDMASGAVSVTGVAGASDMASGAAEVTGATQGFRHLHLGSYSALIPPGAGKLAALLDAKAATPGLTVSYDPNMRPALVEDLAAARATVEAIVARTDVVKVSDEDLEFLYPGVAAGQIAAQWLAVGPQLLIVTRGGAGAQLYFGAGTPPESGVNPGTDSGAAPESLGNAGKSGSVVSTNPDVSQNAVPALTVTPPPATVVDTIGAGDSFMAGLLAALAERRALGAGRAALAALNADDLQACLDFAADTAAITVAHAGPYAPTRAEIHQQHAR
ncbi:kinase, PfkB family [Mobiluncus mulieris ATCC 35239]|uniref:Kinase, PfkB family n=2 Tax=Mobiluncus mulieris TaxID=2052 RepID=E0QNK9_9ACTO|nr:PfkB family carbohydrate kinase [Mobiluncus mulieris]EFM46755.1 kinase, PfkB family [Mobiluncus mulieris ATCC 35239]MCU9970647.1 fructokinase [Mobiluncus mulieris]MCU9974934.1 fructokinase [Mobiluncus mulieris]MCU9993519.1 fructokinase [Mobiluncus mulieris]MCV0013195.1 fructokinase [Mobiluncus mulieris]